MKNTSAFQGVERLYNENGLKKLARSHVMIIGLGGVGSWAAEALIRSGVGKLSLVDLDDICVSNINRQIHASTSSLGNMKVLEMKKRLIDINPRAEINAIEDFFSAGSMDEILNCHCDYIIDAIDGVKSKALLISECLKRKIPLVTTGGAGGKKNPALVQEADLNRSFNCRLLAQTRKKLKTEYKFSRDKKKRYNVPCIFSPEQQIFPEPLACAAGEEIKNLNCQNGFGSSVMVTAVFGLNAAAKVVNDLTERS
ncbi:MAG: tRNA threonylcarbamoyladenosine dehydratase [Bacteriovoracaceae bacterium]